MSLRIDKPCCVYLRDIQKRKVFFLGVRAIVKGVQVVGVFIMRREFKVLKEKLKKNQMQCKDLASTTFSNSKGRISEVKENISALDTRGVDVNLESEEIEELHSLTSNLFTLSKLNTSKHRHQEKF
ncbi:transmembrane protein, putative [Medicago truncatula]|uniref:Transmembrane protein, putative n=1 Tax=Medicago truncatula TaxID=3880 RepID=A0A072U194_MEDTR|nr:transmembrane protein, putative [Medicago truncatula]